MGHDPGEPKPKLSKKLVLKACPFCGNSPTGNDFVSTVNGPAVMCADCGADGPVALGVTVEQEGSDEERLHAKAIKLWNRRA